LRQRKFIPFYLKRAQFIESRSNSGGGARPSRQAGHLQVTV